MDELIRSQKEITLLLGLKLAQRLKEGDSILAKAIFKDYEGEPKEQLDKIHIRNTPNITIRHYSEE